MKRGILLLFFFITKICCITGQNTCLSGVNFIHNQEDVDRIIQDFPDCEIITGNVFIWGDGTNNITNLDGLSNIKSFQGSLQLRDNPELNDLSGLINLEDIGGILYIQGNDQLRNLEGFNNVTNTGGDVFIGQNDKLESFSGLEALSSINGKLTIRNNDLLNDISGLKNIDPYSIDALDDNQDDLIIINNRVLGNCSIENICDLLESEGKTFEISNNRQGCESVNKIIETCSIDPTCIPVAKTFNTQKKIDDFSLDFPYCTHILGDVSITESIDGEILNLNGLSQLEIIGGALSITNNSNLENISGLSNLDTIGRFLKVENNPKFTSLASLSSLKSISSLLLVNSSLINLEGLNNVERLDGDLTIRRNNNITSLDGIEKLKTIGDKIEIVENPKLASIIALRNVISADDLDIDENSSLKSLEGLNSLELLTGYIDISYTQINNLDALSKLTSIGNYLRINNNYNLVSINGISNIDPSTIESQSSDYEDLFIYQNHALSMCNVENVCDVLAIGGKSIQIEQNKEGCFDEDEVRSACITSIDDSNIGKLNIFPNPCFSDVFISTEEDVDYISIVNIYGAIVKQIARNNQINQLKIDVSELKPGIYFILVSIGSSQVWKKMIKK